MNTASIIGVVAYLLLAPLAGGLLTGIDWRITARMQGRFGPPILQPFYDFFKLMEKDPVTVNNVQDFYVICFLVFMVITGCLFFAGGDLLLIVFSLTLANVFLVLGAFSSNSPYSQIGAERELLSIMAYEPMVIITAIGFYFLNGSFNVSSIISSHTLGIRYLPGIFIGFVFILTIKFRKSPFDLSMSHHAHQELVKGMTTEFSGRTLAAVEIAHWYENIFLLGFVYLFIATTAPASPAFGVITCLVVYFIEIFIDNSFARMKWQNVINSSWLIAFVLGFMNLIVLNYSR